MRPYVRPGLHPARPVACPAALAVDVEGRRRATVLDGAAGAAPGLEPLERHRADLTGREADAGHPAALVVNDDIGAVGEQHPRDRLRRRAVGHPVDGETVRRFASHAEAWEYHRSVGDLFPVGFPQWDGAACQACDPH